MHNIIPIETLTIHDISAMAKHAVDRGESLEQANVYEGHIGAAFAAAFKAHSGEIA